MEEPVTFHNKDGKKLFGIVHIPDKSPFEMKIGITILNPGIKYRVAPHRLNLKLARELCKMGYFVFRFDPEGIGDSEGELSAEIPVADLWGQIQSGLFVEDVLEANSFFYTKTKLDKLIMIGSCGGAISALLTAGRDMNVDGLCLVDVPVYLWDSSKSFADTLSGGKQTDRLFYGYLKKIFNARAWYNLITLKADFRTAWKIVKLKARERLSPHKSQATHKSIKNVCNEHKLNYLFFQSIGIIIARGKPVLFVSAGNDPGRETFQTFFQDFYLSRDEASDHQFQFSIIENANHIYSLTEWQEALFNKIFIWLLSRSSSPITINRQLQEH